MSTTIYVHDVAVDISRYFVITCGASRDCQSEWSTKLNDPKRETKDVKPRPNEYIAR